MRPFLFLVLCLGLGALPGAEAHEVRVDRVAFRLLEATRGLERLAADAPLLDDHQVHQHYEAALSAHLLGDHLTAAEGFAALAPYVEEPALQREVQWYRAASLQAAGLPDLARQALDPIVREADHPFHAEAVEAAFALATQRDDPADLLQLAASLPDGERETPHLHYVIGRSWLRLDAPDRALEALAQVPPDHPDRPRARYVGGAAHVARGELDAARSAFAEAATTPGPVQDLAHLALARLAHHQADRSAALGHYLAVGADSPHLPEVLYELVWLHAAEARPAEARAAIDDLLLALPDHPERARLLTLRGHLALQAGDLDAAEIAYADADAELAPVVDTMGRAPALPSWVEARVAADSLSARAARTHDAARTTRAHAARAATVPLDADALDAALEARHRRRIAAVALAATRGLWDAADAELAAAPARGLRALHATHEALARELMAHEATPDIDALAALAEHLDAHRRQVHEAVGDQHHDLATERLTSLSSSLRETLAAALALADHPPALSVAWRRTAEAEQARLQATVHELTAVGAQAEALDHTARGRAVARAQEALDGELRAATAGLADIGWTRLQLDAEAIEEAIARREADLTTLRATFDVARAR